MAKVKEQLEYQMQFQSLALHLRVVQMCCWHVFTTAPLALHVASTYLDLQTLQKVQCRASPALEKMCLPKIRIYLLGYSGPILVSSLQGCLKLH